MAVTIRLYRLGKKNNPAYRIVAIDKRSKRNGKYIDLIGYYDPMKEPNTLDLNKEKYEYWQEKGAILSEGFLKLMKHAKKIKKD